MCSRAWPRPIFLRSGLTSPRTTTQSRDRIEQAIYEACALVAEGPMRGHSRADLTSRPLRFWTVNRYRNYTIVYRPETLPLQVIAVLHGKRNLRRLLKLRR